MELHQLLDTVTVASRRPKRREAHVAAVLTLCHQEIDRCGVEVTGAFSSKGTLTLEIERGPVCKLEVENWQRLLQILAVSWNETTGTEVVAEFYSEDGWFAQEVAQPGIF